MMAGRLLVLFLAICVALQKSVLIGIFIYTIMDIKSDKIF